MNAVLDLLTVGFTITEDWAIELLSDFTLRDQVVGLTVVDTLGEGGEWMIELSNGLIVVLDEDGCNIMEIR